MVLCIQILNDNYDKSTFNGTLPSLLGLQSTANQCRHPLQTLHLDPSLHLQTQALVMSLPKPQLHSQLIMAGKGHSDGSPLVLKAVCEVDQCYLEINFLVHSLLLHPHLSSHQILHLQSQLLAQPLISEKINHQKKTM